MGKPFFTKNPPMLTITYPTRTPKVDDWQDLLELIVVQHDLKEDAALDAPLLKDDKGEVRGEQAITDYLIKLEDEVNQWRSPQCGV